MNDEAPSNSQIIQRICLQLGTEKFFEIVLNEKTFQVSLKQGDLNNNQEATDSIQKAFETKGSLEEALNFVTEQINVKLDAGFDLISAEEQDIGDQPNPFDQMELEIKEENKENEKNKENEINNMDSISQENEELSDKNAPSDPNIPIGQRLVPMTQKLWDFIDEIDKKAIELNVTYDPTIDNILISGSDSSLDRLSSFIEGLTVATKISKEEEEEEEKKVEVEKRMEKEDSGQFLQHQIIINTYMKPYIKEIESQAQKLNLIYENLDDIVLVAGPQRVILDFMNFLYTMTSGLMENQIRGLETTQRIEKENEYKQYEFSISTFHRVKEKEILKRAVDLEVICDFGYDVILVSGYYGNLMELKSYLHEVETQVKKSLYPPHWDFHEVNMFTEIEIPSQSEEFKAVADLFYSSLNNGVEVAKITRIQNKYLMDHYITMLQKRQELRPGTEINRKLLFHGTRNVDPKTIYKNSDTGFDLQYSNPNGAYGKGIYFAVNSKYSHDGYAYNLGNGRFQMFLADVFIGKAFKSQPNKALVKAPDGHDSVEAANNFYIIYNNFHSYPLYLIEYTINAPGRINNNNGLLLGNNNIPVLNNNNLHNNHINNNNRGAILPMLQRNNNMNGRGLGGLFGNIAFNNNNNNNNNNGSGLFGNISNNNNNLNNNNNNMNNNVIGGLFGNQANFSNNNKKHFG